MEKQTWMERFDENFKYVFPEKDPIYGGENTMNKNAVKLFIAEAISEALEDDRRKTLDLLSKK